MLLLDGRKVAAYYQEELKQRAEALKREGTCPGLSVILAGGDKPSAMYAASVERAAKAAGMKAAVYRLAADAAEADVLALIERLNGDETVAGILPLMPLPEHMDRRRVINAVRPDKDADGLTDANIARLYSGRGAVAPCTPKAVLAICDYYGIDLTGREVVIVGRSSVVGKPLAQLCLNRNATVTVCHTGTADLAAVTKRADILVAAAGQAGMIRGDMIRPGAVVIDVGISRVGGKTAGDVAFEEAAAAASAITPVPGGVGAVTTAMLLDNVMTSAAGRVE